MKYLPYKKIILETELSLEKALLELQTQIEPIKFARLNLNTKFFEGWIDNVNFDIRLPYISRSDSFNPQISWKIVDTDSKTKIFLTFSMNKFVLFLPVFLCVIVLWDLISILIQFKITLSDLKFLGLSTIFYLYFIYFWNRGYTKSLDKLLIIFNANTISKYSVLSTSSHTKRESNDV